jgi:hypothetical protein
MHLGRVVMTMGEVKPGQFSLYPRVLFVLIGGAFEFCERRIILARRDITPRLADGSHDRLIASQLFIRFRSFGVPAGEKKLARFRRNRGMFANEKR